MTTSNPDDAAGAYPVLIFDEAVTPRGHHHSRRLRVFQDEPGRVTAIVTEPYSALGITVTNAVADWIAAIGERFPDDVCRLVEHYPESEITYSRASLGPGSKPEWAYIETVPFEEQYSLHG